MKERIIAVFPASIDPLMLRRRPRGIRFVYLAAQDSAEEEWADRFLPKREIIRYRLDRRYGILASQATESILIHSDLRDLLVRARVSHLLITHRSSPKIELILRRCRIKAVSTPWTQQRLLENKLYFHDFLKKHGIEAPQGGALVYRGPQTLTWPGRYVIQEPWSYGSAGTFMADSPARLRSLERGGALCVGRRYLVRRFVPGPAYGITVFLAQGIIALSALRMQCFASASSSICPAFLGIQWVAGSALSSRAALAIEATFLKMGQLLYSQGVFGFLNFDFILYKNLVPVVLECNPRLSSATPQLIGFPELISGVNVGEHFLRQDGAARFPEAKKVWGLPSSRFRGALIDTTVEETIKGVAPPPLSGYYKIRSGKPVYQGPGLKEFLRSPEAGVIFVSQVGAGELLPAGTLAGSLASNFAMFDGVGRISERGSIIKEYFSLGSHC